LSESTTSALLNDCQRSDHWFARLSNTMERASGAVSAVATGCIFAMVTYEIVSRYFFNEPTVWVTEISTYFVVGVAYLGAAYAHREGAHVRVEALMNALPRKGRKVVEQVAAWLALLFVLFATWQCTLLTFSQFLHGTRSYILFVPQWIPNIPIAIGLFVFAIALLHELWRLSELDGQIQKSGVPILLVVALGSALTLGTYPPAVPGFEVDWGTLILASTVVLCSFLWGGLAVSLSTLIVCFTYGGLFHFFDGLAFGWTMTILFAGILGIFFLGVRISLGLGLIGMAALYFLLPFPLPGTIADRAISSLQSFSFTAVPMFVLMGILLLRSGIASDMFDAMLKWLGRFPGGIAHASVGACALFSAVSGSSLATAATMGTIACPEMTRRGYSYPLSYGVVAAGGTLGILIPPSIAMILYGTLVGESVAKLFFAGILPGLILTVSFMAAVFVWITVRSNDAPMSQRYSWSEKTQASVATLPFFGVILIVMGTLYGGVVTPTEAGAIGALLAFILCYVRRQLNVGMMWEALHETAKITSFLMLIIFGASLLTYTFEFLKLSDLLLDGIQNTSLSGWMLMALIGLFYLVLGMFIDPISMMVMTLPVTYPIVLALGYDGIWFGVVLVMLIEIGLITPPVGINLFVLRGISNDVSMKEITVGVLPFIFVIITNILLLYAFPEIVMYLPNQM
jgi:tripartite ATP-independent transporter DctM subunit